MVIIMLRNISSKLCYLKHQSWITLMLLIVPVSLNAQAYYSFLNPLFASVKTNDVTNAKIGFGLLLGYDVNRYLALEGQAGYLGSRFEYTSLFVKPKIHINDKKNEYIYGIVGNVNIRIDNGSISESGSVYGIGFAECFSRLCVNYEYKNIQGETAEASVLGVSLSVGVDN